MPLADSSFSHLVWDLITRFGESQLLVPTLLLLVAWLGWIGEWRSARLWFALVMLAAAVTTATKVAFIGWGIAIPSLNFTGVSGHAMFAAAVLPLLMRCLAASRGARAQHNMVLLGYAAAALVAFSRVVIHAHSTSEAVVGFLLGGAASGLALGFGKVPREHLPRWLLGLLLAGYLLNPVAVPSLRTHDMVTRFALWVSGHEKPYTRRLMHQQQAERLKALQQAAGQASAPAGSVDLRR